MDEMTSSGGSELNEGTRDIKNAEGAMDAGGTKSAKEAKETKGAKGCLSCRGLVVALVGVIALGGAVCVLGAIWGWNVLESLVAKKVDDRPVHAFCIDFNWSGRGYAGLALPEDYAGAKASDHFKWYKDHNVNTIQSFCVSHNGYAWYDSKIAPKVPGLEGNFLKELVDLGHADGMRVMGYFSPATNVYWKEQHPDEIYDNGSMFHVVYTKKYLEYLGKVIGEAVRETGIDGFMIDALFTAPRDMNEPMKWMPCEQEMYVELFGEPFPGVENITEETVMEFKRRSVERCWDTIRRAAKSAHSDCVVWLTCHDLTHPQLREGSRIYKEADWLMNENSDPAYLEKVRAMAGEETTLIQCIAGWVNHDASALLKSQGSNGGVEAQTENGAENKKDATNAKDAPNIKKAPKMGYYGFAWPDLKTTLPYTLESAGDDERFKSNARNIKAMSEFYAKEDAPSR